MEQETIFIGNLNPMKKEVSKKEPFIKKYFPHLMMLAIGIIIAGLLLFFYYEYYTPSKFCESFGEEHSVIFFPYPPTHFCDEKIIELYSDGWRYLPQEINFNN